MENVPDMALDREMFILRSIVRRLEKLGYSVQERVVDTCRYGVPQFRQRLILVALHDGLEFTWPEESTQEGHPRQCHHATCPTVDPQDGWRPDGDYAGLAALRRARDRVPAGDARRRQWPATRQRVYDHITRRVRDDDAEAFEHLDTKTRYSELPEHLKRYRDDIFDDKYKRLDADESVADDHRPHRQGRLLVHPPGAEPHPDDPRGGANPDVPGQLPVRGLPDCSVPSDRQRRAAPTRACDRASSDRGPCQRRRGPRCQERDDERSPVAPGSESRARRRGPGCRPVRAGRSSSVKPARRDRATRRFVRSGRTWRAGPVPRTCSAMRSSCMRLPGGSDARSRQQTP